MKPADDSIIIDTSNLDPIGVLKEIKRSNSTNFWDLNRLPGQTRNYVPKILAIFLIAKNPEKYGFTINSEPDINWIIKKIDKQVSFNQISEITNISPKILQFYNHDCHQ